MTRLIDADNVISLWNKYHYSISTHAIEYDEELRKLPTVDAVPVRHGKWNRVSAITGECSICGELECDYEEYAYCPHCGAKMDAERKEE